MATNRIFTSLAQKSLVILLIYLLWLSQGLYRSNTLTYVFTILSAIFVILDMLQTGKLLLVKHNIVHFYFVFLLYSLISGIIIAQEKDYFLQQIGTLLSYCVVCYDIYYVSKKQHTIKWIEIPVVSSAILSAVQLLLIPHIHRGGQISLGETNNPNDLGVLMLFGIFLLVYRRKGIEKLFIAKVICIIILLYGIILTGSRQALLAAFFFILFWLISYIRKGNYAKNKRKELFSLAILAVASFIVLNYINKYFSETVAFSRLLELLTAKGTSQRRALYKRGLEVWKKHLFFGVGYAQFLFYNSYNLPSHSTYIEALSGGGIIGFLLVLIPVLALGKDIVKSNIFWKKSTKAYEKQILLLMFLTELFLGVEKEWFYSFNHLLIWICISWEVAEDVRPHSRRKSGFITES